MKLRMDSSLGSEDERTREFERRLHEQTSALRRRIVVPLRWQSLLWVEDVLQETYIDAFLHYPQFVDRGDGSFLAWLTRIAENNLLDAIKMMEAEKRGGNCAFGQLSEEDSLVGLYELALRTSWTPSRSARRKERKEIVQKAVDALPEPHATAVRMYHIAGKPIEEVAAALDRSVGACFMLLNRALKVLGRNIGSDLEPSGS